MEVPSKQWFTAVIFEHACKHSLENVLKNILGDKELAPKLLHFCASNHVRPSEKPKIKPVYFLIYLLRKLLSSLENFATEHLSWDAKALPIVIELLETTFLQYNYVSLKKYFTLISAIKLMDLMHLLYIETESANIIQKLNDHFPRWCSSYKLVLEKDYGIENSKILTTVEESHVKCRRLVLKLAVGEIYRSRYMSEQFSSDVEKLKTDINSYLKEIISILESHAGSSVIEKISDGEEISILESDDLGYQLLLDYLQPEVSDENLLRFLQDLEPTLLSQPTGGLASCLLPFDAMSDESDDASDSESEEDN